MPRKAWLHITVCLLLSGGAWPAPRELDPDIQVVNREYPPAEAVTVAVLPFAIGERVPRWGRTLAKQARARFAEHKFDMVPRKTIEAEVRKRKLATDRLLSDEELAAIGRDLRADWVVHGKLLSLDTQREGVLGMPLPTGKHAGCVIETHVVDVNDGELVFRRRKTLWGEVGWSVFTTTSEAQSIIVQRCMNTIYDPLFERVPRRQSDAYKRRAYVREDLQIEPEQTTVAVCRFVDTGGSASAESMVTGATRDAFAEFGFELVDAEKLEYARSKLPHDLREIHDDETLSELARTVNADLVVYGEIAYMDVATKRVPIVRFDVPVPGRKSASCVLRAKVVDVETEQVLYRSERKADDAMAGVEYLTSGGKARGRVARQCVRYLFDDFFEAIQLAS